MKKMWVKKEHMYYIPFYKQKVKVTLLAVILMGVVFFAYQIFYMNQLQITADKITTAFREHEVETAQNHIRGVRNHDLHFYTPSGMDTFRCILSGKDIAFNRVNDDYCDCPEDGSDEPGTNACAKGVFYCRNLKRQKDPLPSSRVNDQICDCCDGSDEWINWSGHRPCPITCS